MVASQAAHATAASDAADPSTQTNIPRLFVSGIPALLYETC
jgi:hypothetical protein